jgi:hypothetical protein
MVSQRLYIRGPGPSLSGERIPFVCAAGKSEEIDNERTRR